MSSTSPTILEGTFNDIDIINQAFDSHIRWYQQFQHNNLFPFAVNESSSTYVDLLAHTTKTAVTSTTNMMPGFDKRINCTIEDYQLFYEASKSAQSTLLILNKIIYSIIIVGIVFNIINLVVLLKSKLNESPYSYLTILALSDLGSLLCIGK